MDKAECSQNMEDGTESISNEKSSTSAAMAPGPHESGTVAPPNSAVDVGAETGTLIYDARHPGAIVHRVSRNQPINLTFNVQNCNPEAGAHMSFGPTLIQEASSSDLQNELALLQYIRADFQELFVPTDAFTDSANILRMHRALVVTGAPGSGKTFTSQQLLLKFCDEEQCNPFQPTVPEEYLKWCNVSERQAFLMDDVFGASNFNQAKYDAWINIFPKMAQHLRSLNIFLIFTCRENILKSRLSALNATEMFNNVINLSDDKYQMTLKNKVDIFENHANKFNIDIRYEDLRDVRSLGKGVVGFPQRVRLFCSMTDIDKGTRIRYFNCPMEFVSTIIGSYRENDHVAYCVLILLLLNDGQLPVSYLRHSNKSSELVQICLDICDISSATMGALRNQADCLCGSFLLLTNDIYVYQHPSVLEAVTLDFGQRYPSDILNRCSVQFLLERVFTQDSKPADNEYVVILQPARFTQLCERLVKEISHYVNDQNAKLLIERHSFKSLSSYAVFKDDAFIEVFLRHLQDTGTFNLIFASAIYDSPYFTFVFLVAISGHDGLVQKVFSSYLRDVQQLSGYIDRLDQILYAACNSGSPGAVELLLAAGAKVDYRVAPCPDDVLSDHWRYPQTSTTLMHAAYSNNEEVLRHLQKQMDMTGYIGIRDNSGRAVLHWWAKRRRSAAALQFLVKAGADINVKDDAGRTVLFSAAKLGDEATCRLLLETGADVNVKGKTGQTAVYIAATQGDESICRLLLKAGANVNMRDNNMETVLHVSAKGGHCSTTRLLVEAGADLHVRASDNNPLIVAIHNHYNSKSDIIDYLIGCMQNDLANTLKRCSDNFLLYHVFTPETCQYNHSWVMTIQPEMFPLLCAKIVMSIERWLKNDNVLLQGDMDVNSPDNSMMLLSRHAIFRNAAFTKVFLLHLVQTNTFHLLSEISLFTMNARRDKSDSLCSSFPLLANDRYKNLDVVDVVKLDYGRRNPSDVLRRWSVRFILERVFTQDSALPGNEFIIILQPAMFLQLCSRLVTEITNCLNDQNVDELRSLSSYRVFKDDAFTQVFMHSLLDTGALHLLFTSASSESQHPTFMFLAAASGQDVLIHEVFSTYLRDMPRRAGFRSQLGQVLYASCYSGSLKSVKVLLATRARVNYMTAHSPDGVTNDWWYESQICTTLMHAAYSNNIEVLRLICDRLQRQQMNVAEYFGIRGSLGRTALHWWAKGGQLSDALQFILKIGVNLNVKDTTGLTVLYSAAGRGDESICRLLLDAGANVNVVRNDGETALHVSTQGGHSSTIRLLVEAGADLHIRATGQIPLLVAISNHLYSKSDIIDYLHGCMQKDIANTIKCCSIHFLCHRVFTQETCPPNNMYVIIIQPEMFPLLCEKLVTSMKRLLKHDTVLLEGDIDVNSPDRSLMHLSRHAVFRDAAFTQVFLLHLVQTNTFHLLSEISLFTMNARRDKSDSLCSSFPLLANDRYKNLDVVDVVKLDFGRRNPSDVLRRWSVRFILERVFTQDSALPGYEFIIILQPAMFSQLSSRLVTEIINCVNDQNVDELRSLSSYRVFKDDAFTQVFMHRLLDTGALHLLFTSASSESQHPTFMFLAAASGQDVLIHEVFSTYHRDVRRRTRFRGQLSQVLYAACYSGSLKTVKVLLTAGAWVNYKKAHTPDAVKYGCWYDYKTCTTLMHAAYSNNVEVLRLVCDRLQQQQVNVAEYIDIRGRLGRTALHWWAEGGLESATLQFIIKAGVRINVKDAKGHTVLYSAAKNGDEDICRQLLIAGADVNVMNNDGWTTLHVCIQSGHGATVRLLVEAGADLHIRASGQIPLDVAILNGKNDISDFIVGVMQKDLANTLKNCSNDFLMHYVFTEQTRPPKNRYAIFVQPESFPLLCSRLIVIIERFLNKDKVVLSGEYPNKLKLDEESLDVLSWYTVLNDTAFTDVFKQHLQKVDALKPLLKSASFDSQHHAFIFGTGRLSWLMQDVLALQKYNARSLP